MAHRPGLYYLSNSTKKKTRSKRFKQEMKVIKFDKRKMTKNKTRFKIYYKNKFQKTVNSVDDANKYLNIQTWKPNINPSAFSIRAIKNKYSTNALSKK